MNDTIEPPLRSAEEINDERLRKYPTSPFYQFGEKELSRIRTRLSDGAQLDRSFYDGLNIGLMCARELEAVDMEYCNKVYNLLEAIRLQVS